MPRKSKQDPSRGSVITRGMMSEYERYASEVMEKYPGYSKQRIEDMASDAADTAEELSRMGYKVGELNEMLRIRHATREITELFDLANVIRDEDEKEGLELMKQYANIMKGIPSDVEISNLQGKKRTNAIK